MSEWDLLHPNVSQIVEKKDWCNRKNNDVLEKCGVPDRISATICEIVLNFVSDPGIETLCGFQ